jgi:hypothetical protein
VNSGTFQIDDRGDPPAESSPLPSTEEIRQQWHSDFEAAVHAATRLLGTAYTSLEINVGSRQAELLAPHLLESLVKGAMAEANDLQAARLQQAARLAQQQHEEALRQAAPLDLQQPPLQRPG